MKFNPITSSHMFEASLDTRDSRVVWQKHGERKVHVTLPNGETVTAPDMHYARYLLAWVYAGNKPQEFTYDRFYEAYSTGH